MLKSLSWCGHFPHTFVMWSIELLISCFSVFVPANWNDRGSVWTQSVEIMQQYLCSSNHSIILVALYHIFFLNSWVWSPGEDLWQWETSAVKWCLSTQGDQELILTLFIMQGYNHLTLLITTGRETVRYWHFFYCFCSEYSFCS